MATEKKTLRRRKKKGLKEDDNLTKEENNVAKHLRWYLPNKKSTMYADEVQYFNGNKAVDFLMDSKWAKGKKSTVEFTDRESICVFLDKMVYLGLISRVHKIRKEKKAKDKKKSKDNETEVKETAKESPKAKDSPKVDREKKSKGASKEESKAGKKKKKVKVSLEPHEDNIFIDGEDEAYVWIYDPIHPKTFVMGILLVIGVIAICLFPLWPEKMRDYSWYISVLAAAFVGVILCLAILRYIVFGIVWLLTIGKIRFWLLPNLTADCGFLDSFIPTYDYECFGDKGKSADLADESGKDEGKSAENKVKEIPEDEKQANKDTEKEDQNKDNKNATEEEAIQEEKLKDVKETAPLKKAEESSGSNRDTDENDGDSWVKVKKADVENGGQISDQVSDTKC